MPGFPLQQFNRGPIGAPPVPIPLTIGGGWNVLTPTVDLNRLGTTVNAIDTDTGGQPLAFPVSAGATYAFEVRAYFSANGAQDARYTLIGPALTQLIAWRGATDNTNTWNVTTPVLYTPAPWTAYPASNSVNTSLGEFSGPIWLQGIVQPSANGTFGFAWAQQVSSAVNPTTRLRGSWMQWKRVG